MASFRAMQNSVTHGGLRAAKVLDDLVRDELAPGTGFEPEQVWQLLDAIVAEFGPRNRALLDRRDELQARIDAWFLQRSGEPLDGTAYRAFLKEIGYLVAEGEAFTVTTENVDPEIATIAGPQLVVPVDKARYALNAANARWGSLYDALYGTDAIGEPPPPASGYDAERGASVVAWTNDFLDQSVPLAGGSWSDVSAIEVSDGKLAIELKKGNRGELADSSQFAGFRRRDDQLSSLLLRNNGLHIEIVIDRTHPVGRNHAAGVSDVIIESAISTIMDCEDSVAAVDADDKAVVYSNWAGIMRGDLAFSFTKNGQQVERRLKPDREYQAPDGSSLVLPGRSLLLVRHVGAHVLTDAVTTADGKPIPETFLDCVLTTLAALHNLKDNCELKNSRSGSLYIVKPKQHGPDEVAMSVDLFARVEAGLGLPRNTLKIGIMDEERRTTVNLGECIRAAKERVIFINTGFLDRTGDEIHTHMQAGPVIPKGEIKSAAWMLAYEDWNVDIGLATGLPGHAQIGKGMWAMPAQMHAMLEAKSVHPQAGANCAWVPSPTAATLHATHYHRVNVAAQQTRLKSRTRASLDDILKPPLLGDRQLDAATIQSELENNAQGILGYVVRWVDQGIGCSTVPDINDIGLMEDRATLRISSQHIANWLVHGMVSHDDVDDALQRMAVVVDRQNADDDNYRAMAPDFEHSIAFQAARDLVFNGITEANGYTEGSLARRRREYKQAAKAQ